MKNILASVLLLITFSLFTPSYGAEMCQPGQQAWAETEMQLKDAKITTVQVTEPAQVAAVRAALEEAGAQNLPEFDTFIVGYQEATQEAYGVALVNKGCVITTARVPAPVVRAVLAKALGKAS